MITGSVRTPLEPLIRLPVRGPHNKEADVDAVIDTGFNGCLSLPYEIVTRLALLYLDSVQYELADGRSVMLEVFEASAEWDGRWRIIPVSAAEGGPLIGISLLQGYHLGIDCDDGGLVEIAPLRLEA